MERDNGRGSSPDDTRAPRTDRGPEPQGRIRALDPFRDLDAVVDLIEMAFGEHLDPTGRATLHRMRRFANAGPLLQWAWALLGKAVMAPGLVWVRDGRLVGNVSVRSARGSDGYLIGNVVVHPDHRGQGIASALMRRAVRVISRRGARWVGLEVRAGNSVARGLYEGLGFREVGRTHHFFRKAGSSSPVPPLRSDALRRGHRDDADALVDLMETVIPEEQRPLLEARAVDYRPGWARRLEHWLRWEDEVWSVLPEDGRLEGALRLVRKRGDFPHQMELLIRSECEADLAVDLVRAGLGNLGRASGEAAELSLPRVGDSLAPALEEEGFEALRVLIQMRRDLRQKVSVRG